MTSPSAKKHSGLKSQVANVPTAITLMNTRSPVQRRTTKTRRSRRNTKKDERCMAGIFPVWEWACPPTVTHRYLGQDPIELVLPFFVFLRDLRVFVVRIRVDRFLM